MQNKLYLILIVTFLSGCVSTHINPSIQNENTSNTVYQEETTESKKINYKHIEIKPSNDDKILTREYTYNSSEDDSKNSSRKKAIQQIKILLTEEIGTHIENYLEIKDKDINGVTYQSIKQEIQSLSAGITKVKVLKEKWNGKTYYIKASVRVNEQKTMEILLQSIKAKSSQKDVKRLNKILAEQKKLLNQQNSQVDAINKKLISQEIINEARKNEVTNMKKELVKYNKEELKQKKEEKKYKTELERKKALIKKLNNKSKNKVAKQKQNWLNTKELLCSFEIGTNKNDIEEITNNKIYKMSNSEYKYEYNNYTYKYNFNYYKPKESRNSENYYLKMDKIYHYRNCPTGFINNLGYNCIYFNLENNQMTQRGGCN